MIETMLLNYLKAELETVPVYMEQPKNPPDVYVIIQVIDAGRINHIDAVTINLQARAKSLYEAAALKEDIKDVMLGAITLPQISHASLGAEMAQTDSANHNYQYELTFNYYYYKEET